MTGEIPPGMAMCTVFAALAAFGSGVCAGIALATWLVAP